MKINGEIHKKTREKENKKANDFTKERLWALYK